MRPRIRWRRGLTACALSAALVVGSTAMTTTSASGAPDVPVAEDITHPGPVYRILFYTPPSDADLTVDLEATGGDGDLTYQVVDGPTVNGESAGKVQIEGSVATLDFGGTNVLGSGTFTYKAIDADGDESNVATVSFDVVNIDPITRELELTTERNKPLDLWLFARDAESGGPFPWLIPDNRVTYGTPKHGTIEPFFTEGNTSHPPFVESGHKAIYVPDKGFTGTDSFTYTITDEDGGSSTGTATVHVTKPKPTVRGEVNSIRYRCAYHIKDENGDYVEGTTKAVNQVMGGAVAFRIDVRAHAPKTLSPGEKFTVPDTEIDLNLPQGMAELLAGAENSTERTIPLDLSGFGQTAVGGQATAAGHFTETATGREYDVPMTGLESDMVPMTLPVPPEGVAIPVKGGLPELTAPQSGRLVVSMPKKFFIDAILEPGVLGGIIKNVGLQCEAFQGEDLSLVGVQVVTPTKTRANAPRVAYGQQAKVNVKVSKKAKGKVSVFKGKKRLGTKKLKNGKATVKLGRTALKPGKHKLRVKFAGSKGFKASKDRTRLRVTKAHSRVRATKAGPKRVVAKKTRARIRVKVRVPHVKTRGRVVIRSGRRVVGKGRVHDGKATIRVKKFKKPGKKRLRVRYLGNAKIKADTDRLRIRVVKRR